MNSALYIGKVFHKRRRPANHVLNYRVFSLLLNLSEIDELQKRLWLFSRNRWNLFSFYDKDFGEKASQTLASDPAVDQEDNELTHVSRLEIHGSGKNVKNATGVANESLSEYVSRELLANGMTQPPHTILLSCYPRVCGFTFNPLSLFYCLDDQGEVFAVLHEVHNTFGERHVYVLPVDQPLQAEKSVSGDNDDHRETPPESAGGGHCAEDHTESVSAELEKANWITQATDKKLFVSPFAHMNMNYEFRLNVPAAKQIIVIKANDEKGHLLTASYTADRYALNNGSLLRCFFSIPFMTFKVVGGIHWEALRLWLKRVPWFSHQAKNTLTRNNLNNS